MRPNCLKYLGTVIFQFHKLESVLTFVLMRQRFNVGIWIYSISVRLRTRTVQMSDFQVIRKPLNTKTNVLLQVAMCVGARTSIVSEIGLTEPDFKLCPGHNANQQYNENEPEKQREKAWGNASNSKKTWACRVCRGSKVNISPENPRVKRYCTSSNCFCVHDILLLIVGRLASLRLGCETRPKIGENLLPKQHSQDNPMGTPGSQFEGTWSPVMFLENA